MYKKLFLLALVILLAFVGVQAEGQTFERGETMNYIYFGTDNHMKAHRFDALSQGSINADKIYLFADFDLTEPTPYEATLMFCRKKDGALIGEAVCLRELAITNPYTGTAMPAYALLLAADVLAVSGELQITARYYSSYDADGDGTVDQVVKALGMVTVSVMESVPNYNGQSTAILALNRKIALVQAALDAQIATYAAHAHAALYYSKAEADAKYGTQLAIDSALNLSLQNAAGTALSTKAIPTFVTPAAPGTLVFTGTGAYILDATKTYVVCLVGSPIIYLEVYKSSENGETGVITYTKMTTNMKSITVNRVLTAALDAAVASDPFDGTYYIAGTFELDGGEDTFEGGWLNFGIINSTIEPVLGLNSTGYFQVYELAV